MRPSQHCHIADKFAFGLGQRLTGAQWDFMYTLMIIIGVVAKIPSAISQVPWYLRYLGNLFSMIEFTPSPHLWRSTTEFRRFLSGPGPKCEHRAGMHRNLARRVGTGVLVHWLPQQSAFRATRSPPLGLETSCFPIHTFITYLSLQL